MLTCHVSAQRVLFLASFISSVAKQCLFPGGFQAEMALTAVSRVSGTYSALAQVLSLSPKAAAS